MVTNDYLKLAESSARDAGKCLIGAFSADAEVLSDTGKDIKTGADHAAEEVVIEALKATGLAILSEESGLSNTKNSLSAIHEKKLPIWIIDPLDGTFNFTRELPMCCVSIALWRGLDPVLGVVYDFISDKLYKGLVDEQAHCNGKQINVSNIHCLSQAALATGFPTSRDYSDASLRESIRSFQHFKKIRMIGSASLSLAHVAAGNIDAYMEEDIWLWDVAAGLALVKAAGGIYKISDIKDTFQLNVSACNSLLSDELL